MGKPEKIDIMKTKIQSNCFLKHLKCNLLPLAAAIASTCYPVYGQSVFSDDFTNYSIGTYPSAGGWQLIYNGAGNGYQEVVAAPQGSGHAFQMVGSSCWSAESFHPISFPNQFTYEAHLMMQGNLAGGCDGNVGFFGIYNPSIGEWGTGYGQITFQTDGYIHIDSGSWADTRLMPFQTGKWYDIACDYNLSTQVMGVRINGSETLAQVSTSASGAPTGIYIQAGHGEDPTLLVENVSVTEDSPPVFTQEPNNQTVGAGQAFSFTSLASGYPVPSYQWEFSTNDANFVNINGATTASFSLPSSGLTNIGYYKVVASNTLGVSTSEVVRLAFLNLKMLAGIYLTGPIGSEYRIDSAPALEPTNWTTLSYVTVNTQPYIYIDYSSATNRQQFYRAVPQ